MIQRHRPQAQTLMTLVCTLLLFTAPTFAGEAQVELGLQKLADATSGWAEVSMNKATGTARFVRIPGDVSKAMTAGGSPQEKAASFIQAHGDAFGVADANDLVLFEVVEKGVFTSVSYQQIHGDVPVFGGVLRVHFDPAGNLVAANGSIVPDLKIGTSPKWTAESASVVAIRQVRGGLGKAMDLRGDLFAADTRLLVFRRGLVQGVPGTNHLVWQVEVVNKAKTVREFVYVDARFNKVVDQITGIHETLSRDVSETSLGNVVWDEGDPDPIPAGWSGGSAQQITDWQDEIDGARETYNFFSSMTNSAYLSYDGASAKMRTVNNDPGISCPNANWNGVSANYCTGTSADDVVAHEWGHAYTEYTNNLIYQWQSGALNESYSDIWGETVDLLNGRGADSPGGLRSAGGCSTFNNGSPDNTYRWLMGEDASAFGTAIRDMWNPNCEGDPGKVTDTGQYICTTFDSGGVHINSGIPNHAYALLVDGGTYNGVTVGAIGMTKAARIHWETQNLLGPASNFVDHADALDTACAALIGATLYNLDTQNPAGVVSGQSITAGDCAEVANAAAAVELRTEPTFCNFQPLLDPNAPALCGGGPVDNIFSEDWESGLGSWSVSNVPVNPATFDTPDWAVVGSLPSGRAGSAAFVQDALIGDCAADIEAGVLRLDSPVINIPAGASPQLAFDHWVATELDWDGGNLKMSVNGGSFNLVASSRFDFNAYSGTLTAAGQGNDNPLAGQAAFTGTDGGSVGGSWGQSQVDLSGLASGGDSIRLRFEMGLDGCNGIIGWYVDDTQVYSCGVDPCGDGFCAGAGAGEDCNTCAADCPSFGGGATCGNGICEAADGENCNTCAADCNGRTGGKPANRFCCGFGDGLNPNGCGDSRCTSGGFQCTETPAGGAGSCCGDGICEGQEDSANCEIDCGPAGFCGDNNIDPGESCDGSDLGGQTCADFGCSGGTLACSGDCSGFDTSGCTGCQQCIDPGQGQPCTATTNCCSGVGNCTGGKPANRVCQ